VALLVTAIATGGRKARDAQGRPTVIYAHPPCPPDLMVYYEEAFADFRRQYPGINLQVLHITGQYEDKIKIMFAGKVAPDVIFMYPTALPSWVDLNALEPLDDLMARDGKVKYDDYFRAGMETVSWNGKVYGLPKDASADILFYNKAMFIEQGIPLPTRDWTWADYLAAAKKLTRDTDGDGRVDVYGASQLEWDRLVLQNGGKVISDDGQRCLLGEPEAIAALKWWAELRTLHKVTPLPEATMDTSTWRLFALKRLGMLVSMYPCVPILRKTCDFEWDITPPPKGPARRYSAFQGSAFAITRQSKNKEAAYTFVRWMTSEGMRHSMTFDIPAYIKLGRSEEWRDAAQPPPGKQVAVDVMDDAGPPAIKHPSWSEINDAITPKLDQVNRGVTTVEEAVGRIVPDVDAILARHAVKTAGGKN
jgi:multiple sugar transport system substrate-binding protein